MVDTDCTGKLSKSEWLAKYGNDDEFGEADQDQDGVIDLNEFLAFQAKRAKRDNDRQAGRHGTQRRRNGSI